MICTKCGNEQAEWDFDDEQLCHDCWEQKCSDMFWDLNVWNNGIVEEVYNG